MKPIDQVPLNQQERDAIKAASSMLKQHFNVEQIILFGSKAPGDADRYSDIDLTVILREPVHWKTEKAIVERLFDIGITHDVIFTPMIVGSDEWKSRQFRAFPVFHEIQQDGALVA
jgi:uncharacterized protein